MFKRKLILIGTLLGMTLCHFSARAVGSFESLETILLRPSSQSNIAAFLNNLKADPEFSSLFIHYTLARKSLSLQSATPLSPRAIFVGDDARLVLTFNGKDSFKEVLRSSQRSTTPNPIECSCANNF